MQIIYRIILSLLLALQLSLAGAVVGASTLIEGGGEVITGKDQLNGIELALVANGTSTEDAKKYSNWIETGVAVITIVNGVAIVSKVKGASKGTLASIDDFATNRPLQQFPDGTFSVSDWTGYPSGVKKPSQGTTYRLLEGTEYADARKLANNTNRKLRKEWDVPADHQIHEIVPVKYGGSPTDPANKMVIPKTLHEKQVTPWWNKLQRDLGG